MFKLEFTTENDAFAQFRESETSQILMAIAHLVAKGRTYGAIHDSNGNLIGTWDAEAGAI